MSETVTCWLCERPINAYSEANLVIVEDDGCGEWECRDRASCIRAYHLLDLEPEPI